MNTKTVSELRACEAIEAEFIYGPVRCGIQTDRMVEIEEDDYEPPTWFAVCDEHFAGMVA